MKRSTTVSSISSSISVGSSTGKKTGGISLSKPLSGSQGVSVAVSKGASDGSAKGLSVVKTPKVKHASELETEEGLSNFLLLDPDNRIQKINNFFSSKDPNSIQDLSIIVKDLGLLSNEGTCIVNLTINSIQQNTQLCEKALLLLQQLLQKLARGIEPIIIDLLPKILSLHADRSAGVRELSASTLEQVVKHVSPYSFRKIYEAISTAFTADDWRVKVGALNLLKSLSPHVSTQVSPLLPKIIPDVTECIYDSKKQVQSAALEALNEACRAITNDDIRHLTPKLVSVIANPDESPATLDCLLETTFVSNVDASTLALIAPLLGKALRGRSSLLKRKAARVIDNMCRLCQVPSDVEPFIPLLLPALDKVIDEIVDAEVCEVAKAAREILVKAVGTMATPDMLTHKVGNMSLSEAEPASVKVNTIPVNNSANGLEIGAVERNLLEPILQTIEEKVSRVASETLSTEQLHILDIYQRYIAKLLAHLITYHTPINPNHEDKTSADAWKWILAMTEQVDWKDCIVPYMNALRGNLSELLPKPVSPDATPVTPHTNGHSGENGHTTAPELASANGNGDSESGTVMDTNHATTFTSSTHISHTVTQSDDFGENLAIAIRARSLGDVPDSKAESDEDEGNVCDIEFSLAFGGKILLHNTRLRLGRGRRYGVMGKNGAGKTTLLTNIGSGNIEGIPPTLKTVYVQHDDNTEDNGVPLVEEIAAGKDMVSAGVTKTDIEAALRKINFTTEMLTSPRSSLSGGWKMKVLIIRAMLSKADVLLLDEPTNHLDTASVAWLEAYLVAQKDVTCLIVSHDTQFLDNVITDVVHYEGKKLVYYHGNLSHFVEIHPEAKYYYDLDSATISFKFPTPGRLEGINSTTRAVMKMDNITYSYPGAAVPTLDNISIKLCLSSRVALLGANGAGKSTLIKLLVREVEPDAGSGEIWKHHNLRVAYIAQHSLHHVEEHLDKSPVDYIKWRFDGGVDKEEMSKTTTKLTEEEEQETRSENRKYGEVDKIIGRRKFGRTLEYECTWIGQLARQENKYIALEKLVEMGYQKQVQQCDVRIAAMAAGLDVRPLLTAEIQKHLDDFNIEAEFGTHGTIRRMSGGQKVKLVLAAAMWNCPHILVLDEPTNYLDRQALGALTQAIKNYGGGVIIISHNREFVDAICTEKWLLKDRKVFVEGEAQETSMNVQSALSMKRSTSAPAMADEKGKDSGAGNTNSQLSSEVILNPKTLESLSKKEIRLLTRCAQVAGVSLKEYVSKITWKSPEWKWL